MDISPFPFFVPGDVKKIAVTIWDLQVVRVVYLMFPIPVMSSLPLEDRHRPKFIDLIHFGVGERRL